ncbi:putative baseplate protein 2 [Bacillus phage BSP18]|nr:putative baseplate protein 2 [Bacillus phage BSP18]
MSFLKHLLPGWKRNIENKTTANGAILAAIDTELTSTEIDMINSKTLMSLDTATGKWLDQYGSLFGVLRKDQESDDDYRKRIISYVLLKRGTIPAIIDALRDYLQDYSSYIEIYEPYTNVFILNHSKLNSKDHFLGEYYTVAVIDIKFSRPFPADIMGVINEFKPAGVTVRLTYQPGANNPDAPIIDSGIDDKEGLSSIEWLRIMNGMNDRIRGHLNLTARSRDDNDNSGVFRLNHSKLNSNDRLAGAFSVGNATYNLASFSTADLVFNNDTKIADVLSETENMSSDFYTKTGEINDLYAAQTVDGTSNSYLYFTMDVATYFDVNYSSYLREVHPDGLYNKDTYLALMDSPYVQYQMNAMLPSTKATQYSLQLFNLSTSTWDTVGSGTLSVAYTQGKAAIAGMGDYLSDNGILFTRVSLEPNTGTLSYDGGTFTDTEMTSVIDGGDFSAVTPAGTVDGNVSEPYEFRLGFYEFGFMKDVAVRPTIATGEEVTGSGTLVPIQ